jgi:hypothetical protein
MPVCCGAAPARRIARAAHAASGAEGPAPCMDRCTPSWTRATGTATSSPARSSLPRAPNPFRTALRSMLLRGQRRLHFHDETRRDGGRCSPASVRWTWATGLWDARPRAHGSPGSPRRAPRRLERAVGRTPRDRVPRGQGPTLTAWAVGAGGDWRQRVSRIGDNGGA